MRDDYLNIIEQYLVRRIKDILKRPPSSVTGCIAILANDDWESELLGNIDRSIQALHTSFMRSDQVGTTVLTSTCNRIGRSVLKDSYLLPLNVRIIVGALFIEALYNNGFINIYRAPYGFKRRGEQDNSVIDVPHMISATPFFDKLAPLDDNFERVILKCTTEIKPEDTSSMFRTLGNYSGPVIKNGSNRNMIDLDDVWVKALDKMQQTPWRINRKVFEALKENKVIFFSKELPSSPEELATYKSREMAYKYTVAKAEKVKDLDKFYQGMDCDYRGRFYHIEPFLSYQGQDFARGVMNFAQGKPMTEEGLQWLAVHTATSFNMSYHKDEIPEWCEHDYKSILDEQDLEDISVDKMSFNDKIEWTNQYMDEIISAGDNAEFFLDEKGESAAEKPVSFLACCVEWFDYWKSVDDGEPYYISHLPIPIDGTSNGWQHLSAMVLDKPAGELVGISKDPVPKDFYVATAKELLANVDPKSEEGQILDKMPMKKIRKQISKRGSMTRAYSAGATTIADNMWVDIKQGNGHIDFFEFERHKELARPIIVELSETLSEIFEKPKDNKLWFTNLQKARAELLSMNIHGFLTEEEVFKIKPDMGIDEIDDLLVEVASRVCIGVCRKISNKLVSAIKEVCPGPLNTMKFFQKLVEYEIGKFKYHLDGEERDDEYRKLKKDRKTLLKTKDKTDEDIEKLNNISAKLKEYESVLVKGNGAKEISWTSPSGFDITYESWITFQGSVFAPIKGYTKYNGVNLVIKENTEIPDNREITTGISPNIVHSFDAAHLALVCVGHQGTFAGIHDSFSTHASDVPDMVNVAKETFIEMYESGDTLHKLKEMILTDSEGFDFEIPKNGNMNIYDLREAQWFFT